MGVDNYSRTFNDERTPTAPWGQDVQWGTIMASEFCARRGEPDVARQVPDHKVWQQVSCVYY